MRLVQTPILAIIACTSACQPEPRFVYVPVLPPEVTLFARASDIEATAGTALVLYAERQYRGQWKRVERKALPDGQCWVVRPPPERESEVADNLHWQVTPQESVHFNTGMRSNHTREVTFERAGTYVLSATTAVWCGPVGGVTAAPITINVHEATPKPKAGQKR